MVRRKIQIDRVLAGKQLAPRNQGVKGTARDVGFRQRDEHVYRPALLQTSTVRVRLQEVPGGQAVGLHQLTVTLWLATLKAGFPPLPIFRPLV